MDNVEKIKEGLEKTYKKLIAFKKYKKTPMIMYKDGKVVEVSPDNIATNKKAYS